MDNTQVTGNARGIDMKTLRSSRRGAVWDKVPGLSRMFLAM